MVFEKKKMKKKPLKGAKKSKFLRKKVCKFKPEEIYVWTPLPLIIDVGAMIQLFALLLEKPQDVRRVRKYIGRKMKLLSTRVRQSSPTGRASSMPTLVSLRFFGPRLGGAAGRLDPAPAGHPSLRIGRFPGGRNAPHHDRSARGFARRWISCPASEKNRGDGGW